MFAGKETVPRGGTLEMYLVILRVLMVVTCGLSVDTLHKRELAGIFAGRCIIHFGKHRADFTQVRLIVVCTLKSYLKTLGYHRQILLELESGLAAVMAYLRHTGVIEHHVG